MSINHQSPQELIPALSVKQLNTTTWGSNANACTISDSKIHPNSMVFVQSGSAPAGRWGFTVTQGQLVISSSDAESSSLALTYIVL